MSKEYWLSSPATSDLFERIVLDVFGFLKNDYGFALVNVAKDGYGSRISLSNRTTGIQLNYEPGSLRIWALFCRLTNGKWPEYPLIPIHGSKSDYFYLEDIMLARDPNLAGSKLYATAGQIAMDAPITEAYLREKLRVVAELVKTYANQVLLGNFSVFEEAQAIMDERVRQASERKH